MKTQINKSSLKQARKNADIPLTTMAEILSMDTSNLSKYERGIKNSNKLYSSMLSSTNTKLSFKPLE